MKQTVEEAANDYLQKILEASDFEINFEEDNYDAGARDAVLDVTERAYIAGAKWQKEQSLWIRAKEQLPPVNEKDISKQSEPVLVKISGHCEPEILVYNKFYHVWDTSDGDDYSCNISDDDLWMPIPTFDEILEANKDVLKRIKEKGD
ncbi:hypothetical protein [Bacteroides salyersiae]|uniref:hypothetical protein n=1 Tax=Bacteroides salyersiae TaxID=291644 RepID=UPI0034A10B2D